MKIMQSILIPALLLLIAACGSSSDSLSDEMTSQMGELVNTLKGIDSVESANASKEELTKVVAEFSALSAKAEALSDEERAALEAEGKDSEEIKELTKSMSAEMMRLMTKPEIAAVIGPILEKMGQ